MNIKKSNINLLKQLFRVKRNDESFIFYIEDN